MYKFVKRMYEQGVYTDADILLFLNGGAITQEEADTILGKAA